MVLRILVLVCLLTSSMGQDLTHFLGPDVHPPQPGPNPGVCLTGLMKNVQDWTDDVGNIIADTDADAERVAIDLSQRRNPALALKQSIRKLVFRKYPNKRVRYLSLARCQLTSVPQVFDYTDRQNHSLSETLQYLTFFGNHFHDRGPPGQRYDSTINATEATEMDFRSMQVKSSWDMGFRNMEFLSLLELDLRSCHIQHLSGGIFEGMPSLTSLYLAENRIYYISAKTFSKLNNLLHLDLSRNMAEEKDNSLVPLVWESDDVLSRLPNLISLDLSLTLLSQNSVALFHSLGKNFQRLSLCSTGVSKLRAHNFKSTTLRFLDISGNIGIINDPRSLDGLQESLQVLYADSVGLKSLESLIYFQKLEILKASHNEISLVEPMMTETWQNLRILDLDHNRLSSWTEKVFSNIQNLEILSMRYNNINLIKPQMLQDLRNVSFLALSSNFFVCTCFMREFFEIAANNEKNTDISNIIFHYSTANNVTEYHIGYYDYYNKIINRNIVRRDCDDKKKFCSPKVNSDIDGTFRLFDYEPQLYDCFLIDKGVSLEFSVVESCNMTRRYVAYDDYIMAGWTKVIIIVVVATVCLLLIVLGLVFRRCFRYFYITVKNSATLSLIADSKGYEDGSIFNYDVFVSYCNEDRPWILDQLLPHVEKDCNISICLHERDFQVGLSILENIVSCVDRSRSIMLVISQRFLLSQWCQFEMHLAQHRLLETRREDLILILLEEIPRRLRPNTLHYLMLTKTYVLWPKDPTEQAVFWKRLKKSLVTRKLKQSDNVSLA